MSSDVLGLVVVGVGLAGKFRIKDILKEATSEKPFLKNVKLVGYVSRRQVEVEGAQPLTMEEALARSDVHALLICTENEHHERLARQAIEAGKHVLVEYPLALTVDGAKSLFSLAQEKGVICYEEDILLVLDGHLKLKEQVKEKGLKSFQRTVIGKPNGWIEDIQRSGNPFVSGISSIQAAIDLCGDVTATAASFDVKGPKHWNAVGKMTGPNKESLTIEFGRDPEIVGRNTSYSVTLGDDTVLDDKNFPLFGAPDPTKPGLFLVDLMIFVSLIRGETEIKKYQTMTLKGLEVAEKLFTLTSATGNK
ncbi:hypothetical protein LSH36_344g02033 [Paralvinella palmiformis]|uniref:Gfo/Idh/MocA-like oxidoreductase N-terminal domain-containing protein n=1 Tax=Paralvinella palmiformis TaxID=53620 RepID=A0AAD9JG01_9ANNE|nr:hypothetical protein LSH36_344g02033 [Paralvinella palmiformis]